MFVHYTTSSGPSGIARWAIRILICSAIGLWMLALSGAMTSSSAALLIPDNGPIRLPVPATEQERLHDLAIVLGGILEGRDSM